MVSKKENIVMVIIMGIATTKYKKNTKKRISPKSKDKVLVLIESLNHEYILL